MTERNSIAAASICIALGLAGCSGPKERCDQGPCCDDGVPHPMGHVCRASAGPCDLAEYCDGKNSDCPENKLEPVSTVCRESAGECDPAEYCDGENPDCPSDSVDKAGKVCRGNADLCDAEEKCDGKNKNCPQDTIKPEGTICRAKNGDCDLEEVCDGILASCPTDLKQPKTHQCNTEPVAEEFECSGTSCGDDPIKRGQYQYCNGTGVECGMDNLVWHEWVGIGDCSFDAVCESDGSYASCVGCPHGCVLGKCKDCTPGSGVCCDNDGNFKPKTVKCADWTEFRCYEEDVCGSSAQKRNLQQFCSNDSATCNGAKQEIDLTVIENCSSETQVCDTDGTTFARCNDCEQDSICLGNECVCKYVDCEGDCCSTEYQGCKYNNTCGIVGKLTASQWRKRGWFGHSVYMSEDGLYVIVGATGESEKGSNSGAAYVFRRTPFGWSEDVRLTAPDAKKEGRFGTSASISGDGLYAIVGALAQGGAYVFRRNGGSWSEGIKLTAPDATVGFGVSVSISKDGLYAIVGNHQNNHQGAFSGAAYVFHRTDSSWSQGVKLTATDAQQRDNFGRSVSISADGSYAIIGADGEDGTIGDPNDITDGPGAAYVFQRSGSAWFEAAKLIAPDAQTGEWFGRSVSICGDGSYAIVGAHKKAAYVFHRTDTNWSQGEKLTASGAQGGGGFGHPVSISVDGLFAIVGAEFDGKAGAAYVFHWTDGNWSQGLRLTAPDAWSSGDRFGQSVSISGDGSYIIVGANDHEKAFAAGAAYVF